MGFAACTTEFSHIQAWLDAARSLRGSSFLTLIEPSTTNAPPPAPAPAPQSTATQFPVFHLEPTHPVAAAAPMNQLVLGNLNLILKPKVSPVSCSPVGRVAERENCLYVCFFLYFFTAMISANAKAQS